MLITAKEYAIAWLAALGIYSGFKFMDLTIGHHFSTSED